MKTQDIYSQIALLARKRSLRNFFGNFRSAYVGKSMEFHDFASYEYGDDSKNIDWLASKREGKILIRRHIEEKQGRIIFALSFGENFSFFQEAKQKVFREILYFLESAAQKSSLHLSSFIFGKKISIIGNEKNHFGFLPKIFQAVKQGFSQKPYIDTNVLVSERQKPSVLFLFVDSLIISSHDIALLSRKHDVIVIHISSHFENTLGENGEIFYAYSGEYSGFIDASSVSKKQEYRDEIEREKQNFKKMCWSYGALFMSCDETTDIFSEFLHLTQQSLGKKL